MKILVAYYSRTGNTAQAAQAVARALGADTEQIMDIRSRAGLFGYLRSGGEAWAGRAATIQPIERDASQYDLVIIASPVWAGCVCSPMRAYIDEFYDRFVNVAFICSQGGRGANEVFGQLAHLCRQGPLATQVFTQRDIRNHRIGDDVQDFVSRLKQACAKVDSLAAAA